MFAFEIFDLEKLSKNHRIQRSQWSIRWQISTCIKVIPELVWLAFTIFHFKFRDLENVGQGQDGSQVAPFDCKYLTSYLMAIVMFAFF